MSYCTGEVCPICKKGKLYPSGFREVREPNNKPSSGEHQREVTEYQCDNCKAKMKGVGIVIGETITVKDEFKVLKFKAKE